MIFLLDSPLTCKNRNILSDGRHVLVAQALVMGEKWAELGILDTDG